MCEANNESDISCPTEQPGDDASPIRGLLESGILNYPIDGHGNHKRCVERKGSADACKSTQKHQYLAEKHTCAPCTDRELYSSDVEAPLGDLVTTEPVSQVPKCKSDLGELTIKISYHSPHTSLRLSFFLFPFRRGHRESRKGRVG